MRATASLGLAAAAALLLAGCTAPEGGGEGPEQTPSGAPAATASPAIPSLSTPSPTTAPPAASPGPTPDPSDVVAGRHYAGPELEQALLAVRAARQPDARLVAGADLQAQASAAEAALAEAEIEPAACARLAADEAEALLQGGTAALLALPDGSGVETVAAVSYPDPAQPARQDAATRQLLEECGTFTMTLGGQQISTTAQAVPAGGDLPGLSAVRTVARAAGQSLDTLSVSAAAGHNRVQVSIAAPADQDAALREAEELIRAVLAELAALP